MAKGFKKKTLAVRKRYTWWRWNKKQAKKRKKATSVRLAAVSGELEDFSRDQPPKRCFYVWLAMCARRVHRDMVGPSCIIDVLLSAGLHIQEAGGSAQGKNNKTCFFFLQLFIGA